MNLCHYFAVDILRRMNLHHPIMKIAIPLFIAMLAAISCTAQRTVLPFAEKLEKELDIAAVGNDGIQMPLILFDFEEGFGPEQVETHHMEANLVGNPGNRRLLLHSFPENDSPGITLHTSGKGWDLNGFFHVKMDIKNLTDNPLQLIMQVGDPENSFERWQMQEVVDLEPGETKTVVDPITVTPWLFSTPLKLVGMFGPPGQVKTDLGNIKEIRVTTRYAEEEQTFEIDNIVADVAIAYVDTAGFLPFMDKFGQYKHKEWPGKIHSEDNLLINAVKEEKDLRNNPGPPDRNKYGGWTAGPRFEATGFFRTQKYKRLLVAR